MFKNVYLILYMINPFSLNILVLVRLFQFNAHALQLQGPYIISLAITFHVFIPSSLLNDQPPHLIFQTPLHFPSFCFNLLRDFLKLFNL